MTTIGELGRDSPERSYAKDEVTFSGHPMVRATHLRTIEITMDEELTPRGDCIIGVAADKGVARLSPAVKSALKSDKARVKFTIVAPGGEFSFTARGDKGLLLASESEMVIRRSSFICGRTLAILADSSAGDLPRELVGSLKSPQAVGLLRIEVYA